MIFVQSRSRLSLLLTKRIPQMQVLHKYSHLFPEMDTIIKKFTIEMIELIISSGLVSNAIMPSLLH